MYPRALDLRALVEHRSVFLLGPRQTDFVVGDDVAIEVKASPRVGPGNLKGLRALSEEVRLRRRVVVSTESRARTTDEGVLVLPVAEFFERLWNDQLLPG
ncbi:MAG: hypothetical protein KJ066_20640 [Acidobacteria bacterium]|nr:hypothetical protein [Acidobacteriota bacterium]